MERASLTWCTPKLCRAGVALIYACAIPSTLYETWVVGSQDDLAKARWVTLRALFGVYALALTSLAWQIRGLVGEQGILPISSSVAYWKLRTFRQDAYLLKLHMRMQQKLWTGATDTFLLAFTWSAVALAVAGAVLLDGTETSEKRLSTALRIPGGVTRALEPLLMAAVYYAYSSLKMVTGEFTQLQWDALLLEAGFYGTVLALTPGGEWFPTLCALHALRFMMFRLWVSSGVVKIMSGDVNWRAWTAMNYHYLTQPLPNVVAWYAHAAPVAVHKGEVLFTFVGEIPLCFLVFFGSTARLVCLLTHAALLLGIMCTGNYGFFQILCFAAELSNLDSSHLGFVHEVSFAEAPWLYSVAMHVLAPATLALCWALSGEPICNLNRLRITAYDWVSRLSRALGPLHACHSYGLFAVMTTERWEINIEGSEDGKTWHEFELPWKPGRVDRLPPVLPLGHMPRLDWRLWFLPLRRGRPPDWFVELLARILTGSPSVRGLFSHWGPFSPERPPRQIRARMIEYVFSKPQWGRGGVYARPGASPRDWWVRGRTADYYGPLVREKEN